MQSSQLTQPQSTLPPSNTPSPSTTVDPSLPSFARNRSTYGLYEGEPAFICTICWASQPHPTKPKLLGTSARIVCQLCWHAVLDLSICWVCGECIVRGDEVVSLGWCFWHRGCFGCLVCGSRMNVPECNPRPEVGTTALGVELDVIPLCDVCRVETKGESEGRILEMGLETVTRYDGGLSRERLEMLSEGIEERKNIPTDGATSAFCNPSPTDERASIKINAAIMGVAFDDDDDDDYRSQDDPKGAVTPQKYASDPKQEIYVSVFNPTGEPPFQPSKTKPLPKWMQLLPNNIHRGRERRVTITSCLSTHLQDSETIQTSKFFATSGMDRDRTPIAAPTQIVLPTPPLGGGQQKFKRATIAFDSKLAEAQEIVIGGRAYRRSRTVYMTPPEHPFPTILSRSRTPFPESASNHSSASNDYFSQGYLETLKTPERSPKVTSTEPHDPELPLSPVVTPLSDASTRTVRGFPEELPSSSSEYLERYHPKSLGTKYERYIAKETEPILEKIRRQKIGKFNMGEVSKEVEKRRRVEKGGIQRKRKVVDEQLVLDSKTGDLLQKELSNLFCEE